jgi:hypothetical protein
MLLLLLLLACACMCSWVEYLEDWMGVHYNASHDLFQGDKPGRVHVKNSAVPGTFSSYMSVCYNMHVPPVGAEDVMSQKCLPPGRSSDLLQVAGLCSVHLSWLT